MKYFFIGLIHCYRLIPGNFHNYCNFTPTCSEYAIECLKNFGFFKGSFLTIKRLIRCNPFHKLSYDPIPKGDTK
ncbi:MAG: membrane protein insertion efficiency factor YidD [Bacilli bacterium]|nr:membrane protein insertion efficiency factor YidD [Bacilli bacterium]